MDRGPPPNPCSRTEKGTIRLRTSVVALTALTAAAMVLGACGTSYDSGDPPARVLKISSIPDQDPDLLAERDRAMANYLHRVLGVDVTYVPVTDYAASVNLFRAGDLDAVFYGGLTGVQATAQVPDARYLAQRDVDATFRSVFIANAKSGIDPINSIAELTVLRGKRFTYGSQTSTSGRLMPEYFLNQAGLDDDADFNGAPGFSGSHDKTIDLVESGTFEAGALNVQVWNSRLEAGDVDVDRVKQIFITPEYHDYHWLGRPDLDEKFGSGFTQRLIHAFLELRSDDPEGARLLKLYGAHSFIATNSESYDQIRAIGSKLGLVSR
jgi:phosphonate transport system substrate-binding protein